MKREVNSSVGDFCGKMDHEMNEEEDPRPMGVDHHQRDGPSSDPYIRSCKGCGRQGKLLLKY